MISTNGFKRKPLNNQMNSTKRFRSTDYDGNSKMIINNSKQEMSSEYRQLQYELQCQEALLVLMQKLKTNQKLVSQTNNLKQQQQQRTTTPVNATKLNSVAQPTSTTKISNNSNTNNRSTPTKPPHPNQYTVNRTSSNPQIQSTKNSLALPQATRQSNTNSTIPPTATRLSSTNTTSTVKPSSNSNSTSSKNNGVNTDQHLINAKLALRKQLEQTLLQIPTPKPTTCDLTYIPGINGWAEFLTSIGLEQAYNTYSDFVNRRLNPELSFNLPNICAQCGTDWSVTWHEVSCSNENEIEEKIFCDRCRKSSQKKILKQDHSNRLRQAFMKAVQQEKELDAKFQSSASSTTVKQSTTSTSSTTSSSSSSSHNKHSNKNLSTKINSSSSSKHSSNNHHSHHSSKSNSIKQQQQQQTPQLPPQLPVDAFASTLAALPTNEQIEFFQKHILSNMFPLAFANQAAAAAAALSPKALQQQQQALAASFPAMAASLMRQGNPAQYLLDMIPQAAKQQQQQQQHHHHRHSK